VRNPPDHSVGNPSHVHGKKKKKKKKKKK